MNSDVKPMAVPDEDALPPRSSLAHPSEPSVPARKGRGFTFGVERFSGLYVIVLMIVGFSLWEPDTFATTLNLRIVAGSEAITGILTIAVVVSLVSGVFDLSVAGNMSLAISVVGLLQSEQHMNAALAVLVTLACGALIGATNAVIVTKMHVDPVIGTLGMSSVLAAVAYWIAQGRTILTGISKDFTKLGTGRLWGIPLPVVYLAAVALIVWYMLGHTPFGRYLYAIGSNPEASRLSGVPVIKLQWAALIISGTLASLAGVVLTMSLGASSFGAGTPYLLPAFAACFLGSTQIHPGRFNVPGTLVAIYLLAIGVKGLQLRYPAASWIENLFEGSALILAVALAGRAARRSAAKNR